MQNYLDLAAILGGLMLIAAIAVGALRNRALGFAELGLATIGLILLAGPSFMDRIKVTKESIEFVSRLSDKNLATIEALSKKVEIIAARLDAFIPPEVKPPAGTAPASGSDILKNLKSQSPDKIQDICQKFPAFCVKKADGFTLQDEKWLKLADDYKALNDTNSQIRVLMQETNDLKSNFNRSRGIEKLG